MEADSHKHLQKAEDRCRRLEKEARHLAEEARQSHLFFKCIMDVLRRQIKNDAQFHEIQQGFESDADTTTNESHPYRG